MAASADQSCASIGHQFIRFLNRPVVSVIRILIAASALVAGTRSVSADIHELPVIQDNSIVMVDGEWNANAGQAGRIRIKGNQHIVAMSFDTSRLAGKQVRKATLICHQGEQTLNAVTISTIAVPWDENRSSGLTAGMDDVHGWGYPGARFPAVCGGNAFTLVHQTQSEIKDGSYHWDIPPEMLHALTLGVAYGLAVHEHDADYSRNPTIFSREQSGRKPRLVVEVEDSSPERPMPAADLQITNGDSNSARLSLRGPASGFAYRITIDGHRLGQHNIPLVQPGSIQQIFLRDLPESVTAKQHSIIEVVTLGPTGLLSSPVRYTGPVFSRSKTDSSLSLKSASERLREEAGADGKSLPDRSVPGIRVIPLTDKFDLNGAPVGSLPNNHLHNNSVFDGREVRLMAAAGEVVGFQILLRGTGTASVSVDLDRQPCRVDLHQARFVASDGRMIPDPVVRLTDKVEMNTDRDTVLVADVFVPFDAPAGTIYGHIRITDGRSLPMRIEVLPWALPRTASFVCEMNGYGLPDHVDDYFALQRVAYDHRVHANILHYSHNTAAPGSRKSNLDMRLRSGRRMDNRRYDNISPGATNAYWDDFVEAFGPFLDGSLFADGHRGPIAPPGFYLTFHESWPLNCRQFFNGHPDAYIAFQEQPVYAQTYVNILRDFVATAEANGWSDTGFQVYFNNKGSLAELNKAPWILDEPSGFWDYRALQFYGELTDQGRIGSSSVSIDYRIDISRPEYCRGQLSNRRDLWVVSSWAFQAYRRLVRDRMEQDGLKVWIYGTSNHVHDSNRMIQAWALDAWKDGASGIVPWQTIDKTGQALQKADQLGLFIFDQDPDGRTVIHHSLRLKAYREAQQLIEHLSILEQRMGWSRDQTSEFISGHLSLESQVNKTNDEDAGTSNYQELSPARLDGLRLAAIERILASVHQSK